MPGTVATSGHRAGGDWSPLAMLRSYQVILKRFSQLLMLKSWWMSRKRQKNHDKWNGCWLVMAWKTDPALVSTEPCQDCPGSAVIDWSSYHHLCIPLSFLFISLDIYIKYAAYICQALVLGFISVGQRFLCAQSNTPVTCKKTDLMADQIMLDTLVFVLLVTWDYYLPRSRSNRKVDELDRGPNQFSRQYCICWAAQWWQVSCELLWHGSRLMGPRLRLDWLRRPARCHHHQPVEWVSLVTILTLRSGR